MHSPFHVISNLPVIVCVNMATMCANLARAVESTLLSAINSPIDLSENTVLDLQITDSTCSLIDDSIFAPPSIAACEVELTAVVPRVLDGEAVVFKLTISGPTRQLHPHVLTALVLSTVVTATLHTYNLQTGAVAVKVAVNIEATAALDGVVLDVTVPTGTPDGTLVTIDHIWVAGYPVVLNELQLRVTIGFNHAPAAAGAVSAAAEAGNLPWLMLALRNGGSTEERGHGADYNTPLHTAAYEGFTYMVKELLVAGADVNAKDMWDGTPLHWASEQGRAVVADLVAAGADVNWRDSLGQTPLHLAAMNGHTEAVKELVAAGADVRAKDSQRRTPLDWAQARGKAEVVAVLQAVQVAAAPARRGGCGLM